MRFIRCLVKWIVVIGALNWGLIGFFDYNLVAQIFGEGSTGARVVYCIVGVAGLLCILCCILKCCCKKGCCKCGPGCGCGGCGGGGCGCGGGSCSSNKWKNQ